MKSDQIAQVIKMDGNHTIPSAKLFHCLAVLMAGSYIPLKWSSPASPHMASPQATQTIWTFPEFCVVYQLFFYTGGPPSWVQYSRCSLMSDKRDDPFPNPFWWNPPRLPRASIAARVHHWLRPSSLLTRTPRASAELLQGLPQPGSLPGALPSQVHALAFLLIHEIPISIFIPPPACSL